MGIVVHGKVVTHSGVATNSTRTTVVHTNSRRGSGHKQYMCPSQSASRSGKQRLVLLYMKGVLGKKFVPPMRGSRPGTLLFSSLPQVH